MSACIHFARRSLPPAVAASAAAAVLIADSSQNHPSRHAACESPKVEKQFQEVVDAKEGQKLQDNDDDKKLTMAPAASDGGKINSSGMWGQDDQRLYNGLFPRRQLWRPRLEYPLWDYDWDGRRPIATEDKKADVDAQRVLRKNGITRHIILIRHGQYDESHKEDEKRLLTKLGRDQADSTGKRIAELIKGVDKEFGPCNVKVLRVSDLARAKETADIIAKHLPDVERADPDPLLNEGRPCHTIPGGKARQSVIERTDEQHTRIESAFRKYFFRAVEEASPNEVEDNSESAFSEQTETDSSGDECLTDPKHEFEIIVCHANVIRYFFCRALQLQPEAWLRLCTFNCSLNYFTIRPTGTVSCRMLGDIGHLPYELQTFSGHHGFNW